MGTLWIAVSSVSKYYFIDQIGYDNDAEDMIIRMMILMMIMLILIITHVGIQVVGKMVLCSSRRSSRARKVPTT